MNSEQMMITIWVSFLLACSAIAWLASKNVLRNKISPPSLNISIFDYLVFLWVLLMLFVGVQTLIQFMILGGESSEEIASLSSDEWELVLGSLSLQIPFLGVMLLAYSVRKLPFFHADVNHAPVSIFKEIFFGFRIFIMCLPIIWGVSSIWKVAVEAVYGLFSDDELQVQQIVSTVSESTELFPIITLTLLGIIMAPIAEELFFRGSVYRFIKATLGASQGIIWSALIFACVHWNLRALLPLFLVGVCLAWVYERRGNIWAPIAFHMAFNAQSFVLIYILRSEL
ncbi:MAG: CPBP family intramembrane glutamic endopeptidase [Verrucomicrobiota bacterium]